MLMASQLVGVWALLPVTVNMKPLAEFRITTTKPRPGHVTRRKLIPAAHDHAATMNAQVGGRDRTHDPWPVQVVMSL